MLNPVWNKNRIAEYPYHEYGKAEAARMQFKTYWDRLNHSDFRDGEARHAVLGMIDPLAHAALANYLISNIRWIHNATDLDFHAYADYLASMDNTVREMVLHRVASFPPSWDSAKVSLHLPYWNEKIPQNLRGIQSAMENGQYHPNFPWLASIHFFTRDLLVDLAREISAQYPQAAPEAQLRLESSLVAATIVHSQATFDQIYAIVRGVSPELADRIRTDRQTFLERKFAYHFTRGERVPSIAEKGLSAQFAPPNCEQPEAICFDNAIYAGVEEVTIGLSGYYSKDILLRVPLEPPIRGGLRFQPYGEQLGDLTADYLLDRKDIIPPEKIEIVDPLIATRAVPLIIT